MTESPVEGRPRTKNCQCAVAPIGINQNQHVHGHHDQLRQTHDESRVQQKMEANRGEPSRERSKAFATGEVKSMK